MPKTCLHEGCTTRPTYGKKGGTRKDAEYCVTHKPEDYVNVVNKTCLHEDCTTRPTYGRLFKQKVHCAKHKKNNEYKNNSPICEYDGCNNRACYSEIDNYPIRCEVHMKDGDMNVVERKCKKCGLYDMLNEISLCNDCNVWFEMKIEERKETQIRRILESDYKMCTNYDRIPYNSCYKYRPDFWWDLETHIIILEVDEVQHKSYSCECEHSRMINITQDFGGIPVIWVRFNPDSYVDNKGVKHRKNLSGRMPNLIKTLHRLELHIPDILFSVLYLYYDGFDKNNIEVIRNDLSILGI